MNFRTGKINAYISEASTSLEAISNDERVDTFLRQWASRVFPIQLPELAHERKRVFEEAIRLGLRILRVPRIALGTLIEFPENAWAEDINFPIKERLDRYGEYIGSQPDTGVEKIKELGAELVASHGLSTAHLSHAENLMWMKGLLTEYDSPRRFTSRKSFLAEFRDRVAEWFDMDIQASHCAYGHDYLCTFDSASNAGTSGIMHATRISANSTRFGIEVVRPSQLVKLVQSLET